MGAGNENNYHDVFNNIGATGAASTSRFSVVNNNGGGGNQLNKTEDIQNSTFGTT